MLVFYTPQHCSTFLNNCFSDQNYAQLIHFKFHLHILTYEQNTAHIRHRRIITPIGWSNTEKCIKRTRFFRTLNFQGWIISLFSTIFEVLDELLSVDLLKHFLGAEKCTFSWNFEWSWIFLGIPPCRFLVVRIYVTLWTGIIT